MSRPILFPSSILLCLLAIAPLAAGQPEDARVPSVTGLDLRQAADRIQGHGLEVAVLWVAGDTPGKVVHQDPSAGEYVPAGSVVEVHAVLRISIETIVPDVRGMAAEEALEGLEPAYLVEVEEVDAEDVDVGRVLRQEPRPGTRLALRGTVRLVVGRAPPAPEQVAIPLLRGRTLAQTERILHALGLVPYPVSFARRADAASPWTVRAQSPAADTPAVPGTRVQLEIALPSTPVLRLALPDLYGLNVAEAARVLSAVGMHMAVRRVPALFPPGTVIAQEPAPGSEVGVGSAVLLRITTPPRGWRMPPPVSVPLLTGRRLGEAWRAAREAGVRLEVRRVLAPGYPVDVVLTQQPAGGSRTALGASVRIDLPAATLVPAIVGLSVEEAALRAAEAGLGLELDTRHPVGPRARIAAQEPEPGVSVARGGTLRATVHRPARAWAVPDLTGLTLPEARALLATAGLLGRFTGPPVVDEALTEILSQSPPAGTELPRGSLVSAAYRLRPAPTPTGVRVPDLIGRSLEDAQRMLADRGLAMRVSFVRGGGPPGVIGQSVPAGTVVAPGSEVVVTYRR